MGQLNARALKALRDMAMVACGVSTATGASAEPPPGMYAEPPPSPPQEQIESGPRLYACEATVQPFSEVTCMRLPAAQDGFVAQCEVKFSPDYTIICGLSAGQPPPRVETGPFVRGEFYLPSFQLGFGQNYPISTPGRDAGFSFQALLSVQLMSGKVRQLGFRPELGYASDKAGPETPKLFVAGIGPLWAPLRESMLLEFRYAPRFVYGRAGGEAVGFRHAVAVQGLFSTLGLEVSHELLWVDGQKQQDARVLFVTDPIMLSFGLLVLMFGGGAGMHGRPLLTGEGPVVAPLERRIGWA